MKSNPYIAGNPVGGGEAFIGRADVLRDVLRVLKNPKESGMVLYGQRRIGKTSVLQELAASLPQQGLYAPVYFDLQDKAALPLEQVLHELVERIVYNLDIPKPDNKNNDFVTEFRQDVLPYILSRLPEETALVLLFDEFDVLDNPSSQQAGSAFFPYLRDLMSLDTQHLKFIFVIGRRPEDLSSLTLSVFKGVKSRHVSLLSAEDTAALVRLSEKNGSLKWVAEALEQVYRLTGGHPFLTQQLCQVIWENMYDDDPGDVPPVQVDDIEQAVPEALKSAANSLQWLWDGLKPAQRVVASALAEAGPEIITQEKLEQCLQESGVRILIGELQDAPKVLAEWDLIRSENGGYRIPAEMLRRWIVKRKPLSRVQDELDRILPVADNLFQAAYGMYQGRQLQEAVPLLQQAVGLNPNHLKANQLLAEIFLAQEKFTEARKILETLYEYNPAVARPRLIQVLISQAKEETQENEQLALYEKVLVLDSNQPEAISEYQKLWRKRGDIELKNSNIDNALDAYKKAYEYNDESFQHSFIQALLSQARERKQEDERLAFYEKVLELEPKQPEALPEYQTLWEKQGDKAFKQDEYEEALKAYKKAGAEGKIDKVNKRLQLENLYREALEALESNERQKAQRLLVEVMSIEPEFREAARYMYLAVTGIDPIIEQPEEAASGDISASKATFRIDLYPRQGHYQGKIEHPLTKHKEAFGGLDQNVIMDFISSHLPPLQSERIVKSIEETGLTPVSLEKFEFEVATVNAQGEEISRKPGKAQQWVEDLGNGIILEMVPIPGGTFVMGAPETEKGWSDDEGPQHQVTVAPFYIGKFPVTQEQWEVIMKNNPSDFKGAKRPVERISEEDVVKFCEQISEKTGYPYRLPSEAEWEYACRAGTTTPFYFGETLTSDLANYNAGETYASESKGTYRQETTEVGSFPPNAFGLYDMHGNVWERCADIWHENYNGAPSDGSVWEESGDASYRVRRGGSWGSNPNNCRAATRYRGVPVSRDDNIGIRVVVSLVWTLQ